LSGRLDRDELLTGVEFYLVIVLVSAPKTDVVLIYLESLLFSLTEILSNIVGGGLIWFKTDSIASTASVVLKLDYLLFLDPLSFGIFLLFFALTELLNFVEFVVFYLLAIIKSVLAFSIKVE